MRRFAALSLGVVAILFVVTLAAIGNIGERSSIPKVANEALEKGTDFELFSLNPAHLTEKPENHFHGWEVLGSTKIDDAKTRGQIVAALRKGVAESDGMVAACFNPRHGIRVQHGGKTIDLVICFECLSAAVYVDGERSDGFLTTSSPQATFDRVLKAAASKAE
jgi:hypothetical protein